MPAGLRRRVVQGASRYEPVSTPRAEYDTVVVDASAAGMSSMAPVNRIAHLSMRRITTSFVRAQLEGYPTANKIVVCYDDPTKNPRIRSDELYLRRYGTRLPVAPSTMCEETHFFAEGKVWAHGDQRAPATAEDVESSTLDSLGATIEQLLASRAGKARLMALHATGVRIATADAIARGCFKANVEVTIVPPRGDECWELRGGGEETACTVRETRYGEADLLIVYYAREAVRAGQRVCLSTIDTDVLLQTTLYARPSPEDTLDVHIANVYLKDGEVVPKKRGGVRCREIVSIGAAALSPATTALVLVYGCDYVRGLCIRGIGLPKQALFELIMARTADFVTLDPVRIDFAAMFTCLARACREPNNKPVDADALNGEMQRIAYCLAYWAGVRPEDGGPEVDGRRIVPVGATRASLLAGEGCPVLEYQ